MLSGVNVLDFSRVLAGPLCSMMLGDLGANVIKIERPSDGDESRGWGPPFHPNGMSSYFLSVNRNKKSIALDLDVADDREVIRSLLEQSHVVLDNFRPGTLERRGVVPGEWLARVPSLVWCTITGFGADSGRPGYDFVVQAERGWMSITGEPDGRPMKTGVALADVVAGKDAVIGILAALSAVSRGATLSAEQRRISISLADSATAALVNVAQNALISGDEARRFGNAHPNLVPYQLFEAADRSVVLAVGNDAQWRNCLRAIGGLDDLAADPALATNAGRVRQRERVVSRIASRLMDEPAEHWTSVLGGAGVPCGTVRTVMESLEDISASPLTGVAPAVAGSVRLAPPALDEHGSEIRAKGWSAFANAS